MESARRAARGGGRRALKEGLEAAASKRLAKLEAAILAGASVCAMLGATGCASSSQQGMDNHVFFQTDAVQNVGVAQTTEWAYSPLDAPSVPPLAAYDGVSVFDGMVHLSRPRTWIVRSAGGPKGRRFVEYDAPHAYLFTLYEMSDSLGDWNDALNEYETEATKAGGEFLSKRVPMAIANGQGFAYVVRRTVTGAKGPLINYCHEYVLRGDHRIVLAQIVHHAEFVGAPGPELRRVIETMEVP
jgi:hypothetical protein